ncbi:MAG: hypothetical protein HY979_02650 [Candidatus Magasanikbacteria bacterium]|nr:hypothetical protein [Candidatus Magasanikbacteria bacterium]
MGNILTGDQYKKLDSKLDEIKRQLKQKNGYPFDQQMLNRALQLVIDGQFVALGLQFPCQVHVPELIPDKWEVLEDVEPTADLDVSKLTFKSVLQGDEDWVNGDTMRGRAVTFKGNYGLSDAPQFLAQQAKIPVDLRDKYILLPGTKLRGPCGLLRVPCFYWRGDRWVLNFFWLGNDFRGRGRVACSE